MLVATVVIVLLHPELDSSGRCQPQSSFSAATLAGSVIGGVIVAVILGIVAFFTTYCCYKHLNTKQVSSIVTF